MYQFYSRIFNTFSFIIITFVKYYWVTTIVIGLVTFYLINKINKGKDTIIFSKKEKIIIRIVCLLNPIVAGFILYYGLRKKNHNLSKQANKISFKCFGIAVIFYILIFFFYVLMLKKYGEYVYKNPEEVIQIYQQKLLKDPNNEDYLIGIANTYLVQIKGTGSVDEWNNVIQYYDKVLSVNPKNESALSFKVGILAKLGKYEEAKKLYDLLFELNPKYKWLEKLNVMIEEGNK